MALAGSKRICKITLSLLLTVGMALMSVGCSRADRMKLREEGVALYQEGDYAGAIERFNEALDASRGQVSDLQLDILKYRAECELRLGRLEEARASYEALKALEENAEDTREQMEAYFARLAVLDLLKEARAQMDAGAYKEAAEVFREHAALDGSYEGQMAWFNQAVCTEYLLDFSGAAELWRAYLEVFPEDAEARKEYEFCKTR